jgi:hypothetical protein
MRTVTADAAVGVAPRPAPVSEPWTPKGLHEDVVESEGEALARGGTGGGPCGGGHDRRPRSGGSSAILSCSRTTFVSAPQGRGLGAAADEGLEVVLGHPTPYASGDISMGEAVSMAHQALSQAHRILHCKGEDLTDERRHL